MARGKAAAANANRRAHEADARTQMLREQLAKERAEWADERAGLLTVLQQTRNRLTFEVDNLSAQALARVTADYEHKLSEERERHEERARRVLDEVLNRYDTGREPLPARLWLDIADALGVENRMYRRSGTTRVGRRRGQSNKSMRNLVSGVEDMHKSKRTI